MPRAGNRNRVFQWSMYSALPRNVIRRGDTSMRNAESRNEMWFGARIAAPVIGTFSTPSTRTSHRKRRNGLRAVRATSWSRPATRSSVSATSVMTGTD
jgi:hypothetical protein